MIILRPHQIEAHAAWLANGGEGIIKSVTGSGKTHIVLKIIEDNPIDIWIVVPTIPLQEQWAQHLKDMGLDYGLVGNGHWEVEKSILIFVDKSLQAYMKGEHNNPRLLVLDEVHRMLSIENYKAFTQIEYSSIIGLSATPEKEDSRIWDEFSANVPVVYEHTLEDAMEQGTVCKFETIPVKCKLLADEQQAYDVETAEIKRIMPMFAWSIQLAMSSIRRGGQGEAVKLAVAIRNRKKIITNSKAKILEAARLIDTLDTKIIVFSESIEAIELISEIINEKREKYMYHSKIKKKQRTSILEQFKNSRNGVLFSAKALDEGLNVPDVDTAIMVSGSASARQFIQRLGRILRPKEGKEAKLYELYVEHSIEEKWMRKRKQR